MRKTTIAKPYALLRKLLDEKGIDQKYLCELLKISQTRLTTRLNNSRDWKLSEQYALLDLLDISYAHWSEVFPKGGYNKTLPRFAYEMLEQKTGQEKAV
nr:MAG TPA: SOS-response transcriptional repressor [Caudoviricetes sp.]